jgi:uncharacterized membrane protein YqjE
MGWRDHKKAPSAFLVLLIPFYFMSSWIEARVSFVFLKGNESLRNAKITKVVWKANRYSYAFLAALTVISSIFPILKITSPIIYLSNHIPFLDLMIEAATASGYWLMGIAIIWKILLILGAIALIWMGYKSRKT